MIKALVVDDDAEVCRKALHCLARPDLKLVAAANGQEALEIARELKPDIVITDVDMPVMDGFELLAALRSEPDLADMQIMMLTTEGARHSIRLGMQLGADDYLVKPFTSKELLGAFDGLLRKRGRIEGVRARTFRRHWWQVGVAYMITTVCCAAAIYAWYGWRDARSELDHDRMRLKVSAEVAGPHSRELLNEAMKALIKVRDHQTLAQATDARIDCHAFFKGLTRQSTGFVNIGVVNRAGKVECEAQSEDTGRYVGDKPHVRQVLKTGLFSAGEYEIDDFTGRTVLTTGLPLKDADGQVTGVAFSMIDITAPDTSGAALRIPSFAGGPTENRAAAPAEGRAEAPDAPDAPTDLPQTVQNTARGSGLLRNYLIFFGGMVLLGLASLAWAHNVFARWTWSRLFTRA